MQMMGSITVLVAALTAASALSVSMFAAMPKVMLMYAENHGRFQGLHKSAQTVSGRKARLPPFSGTWALQP